MKIIAVLLAAVLGVILHPPPAAAQDGQWQRPAGTGYFKDGEVAPGAYQLYLQQPEVRGGYLGIGPGGGELKRSSFYADAHADEPRWQNKPCVECHAGTDRNLHMRRANLTCAQCHKGQVIPGVFHYFSALNPIRRHAYVCAQCHDGATPNFSAYVIHEPNPLQAGTLDAFPGLYYAVWFMVILAGGVFIFFLPYTALWGVRELIALVARRFRHG